MSITELPLTPDPERAPGTAADDTDEIPAVRLGEAAALAGAPPAVPEDEAPEPEDEDEDERRPIDPIFTSVAAALGGAAAGFTFAGAFEGGLPRLVAVVAALVAGGVVTASYRTRNPSPVQLLVLPGALLAGTALTFSSGVTLEQLPHLVMESLRSGGLGAPPVAFDPGWRILLTILTASLTVTAATTAVALDRARLAVLIPGAVTLAGVLVQPPGGEVLSVAVALVLLVGGLAVAYSAELAREGVSGGAFEVRRMARAGGIGVLLVVLMVALSQLGFLLPEADKSQTIPPERPEQPAPPRDRVMFTVDTPDTKIPWRVGTLDVYSDNAWMTPPYDPGRLVDLAASGGAVAEAVPEPAAYPGAVLDPAETVEVTFTLLDVEGRIVPQLPGVTNVVGDPAPLRFDPRTQVLEVSGRQPAGTVYTVTAAVPPTGEQMAQAAPVDAEQLQDFLQVPEAPPQLRAFLRTLPDGVPPFVNLQTAREQLYEAVVATGTGNPVDVAPDRVAQMLLQADTEASPYEIVAGEVLLARWLGVPARIGYGYYGGEEADGVLEVRPQHGAMWLEAYFEGHGFVPIVGRPPRAKSSLDDELKINDPNVAATDTIVARVYVPVRSTTIQPLYVLLRYWLSRIFPFVLGLVVAVAGYPWLFKLGRRWRRRRWGDRHGPRGRIAVAYADIRDRANDLNIGHPSQTPIEFLDAVESDVEHRELAWLVTRVMWADLTRGVDDEDAHAAEELARSFRKRLVAGQPYAMRTLAAVSRVSLKEPWDPQLPNLWWGRTVTGRVLPARSAARRRRLATVVARIRLPRGRTSPEDATPRPRWSRLAALVSWVRPWRRPRRRGAVVHPRRKSRWARLRRRVLRRPRLRTVIPALTLIGMLVAIAITGGVQRIDLTTPATFELPEVPEQLAGYGLERNPEASEIFSDPVIEEVSLAVGGEVYGIRHDGVLTGTLQVAAFKPGPRAHPDELRAGMLSQLLVEQDDVVRLGGELVYVRRIPEQTQYLWLAPDLSSFQLLVTTRRFTEAEAFFAGLLATQRGEQVDQLEPPTDRPPLDPRRSIP